LIDSVDEKQRDFLFSPTLPDPSTHGRRNEVKLHGLASARNLSPKEQKKAAFPRHQLQYIELG
jgi:hypothetical protein